MAFSDIEKKNIRNRLLTNCEASWSTHGYKKTSVDELCVKSGISKGSFYLFYESKEDIFCEVMIITQERLVKLMESSLGDTPTKEDLIRALQLLFREYSKLSFVVETQTPDFIAFINKLSPERLQELQNHGNFDIQKIIQNSGLTYRVEEAKALSALSLVFRPLPDNHLLPYDLFETADFIIETLIDKLFV